MILRQHRPHHADVVHEQSHQKQQTQETQDGLYLATDNDVVAYLDLIET